MASDNPDFKLLGRAIRTNRETFGWSQQDLAHEANVSQRFISKIETGQCKRPGLKLLAVVSALGLSPEFVLRTGPDEPIVRTLEDFARELDYRFDVTNRPDPIELRTEDRVVTSLPESPYDLSLVLTGPARLRVEEDGDGGYALTIRFDGTPDGRIAIVEDGLSGG